MEQCSNCKHDREAHKPTACACGCAVLQAPSAPLVFNSITPGDEITQQMEKLKRLREAKTSWKNELWQINYQR